MATIDTIAGVLESNLDIDPATVTPEATFESLGIDSLDMVELICDLEEACEVDFGEPEGLVTVGDLVAYASITLQAPSRFDRTGVRSHQGCRGACCCHSLRVPKRPVWSSCRSAGEVMSGLHSNGRRCAPLPVDRFRSAFR